MKRGILVFLLLISVAFGQENYNLVENQEEIDNVTLKEPRGNWKRLRNQTLSAGILSAGTLVVLYSMPESITGWEREDVLSLNEKWKENVTTGPQWDHDKDFFNWVAHPYVGATYYIAARKSDFNQFDSFLYSAAMSSFFWEYGIEAFAEIPSVQDLIITPVLGAFLGEYLYFQEQKIIENNGELFESRFLGKTALIVIDPIGALANLMGFDDENVMGSWNVLLDNDGDIDGLQFTLGGRL